MQLIIGLDSLIPQSGFNSLQLALEVFAANFLKGPNLILCLPVLYQSGGGLAAEQFIERNIL